MSIVLWQSAQVPASSIAATGTASITAQTPAPGGGASNSLVFEIDSPGAQSDAPVFATIAATVTAGSSATYPVTMPASATEVTATCLNLPAGASCTYSASANGVTIATSPTTPPGTYQITVVFTETVAGSATALLLFPIVLVPLVMARKKLAAKGVWLAACLVIALSLVAAATGCGGQSTARQNQIMTSSGTV
jgi:hypothetical protein